MSKSPLLVILDALPAAVSLHSTDSVMYTNPAHAELLGYTTEEFRELHTRDYVHAGDLAMVRARTERCRRGLANGPAEIRLLTKGGQHRVARVSTAPMQDGMWVVLSVDQTDLWRVREGMETHARMASFGDLAAKVAHELNQPLRTLVQDLAVLRSDLTVLTGMVPKLEERMARLNPRLDSARKSAARLASLTEDLEAYADADGHSSLPHELKEILESAVELAWPRLRKASVAIFRDFQPTPRVMGNESRLVQLFLNLLDNAGDALEGVEGARRLDLSLRSEPGRDMVVVSVRDSGPGPDPASLPKLVEPFFTTRSGARGMGLSISHSIAASLGGSLQVRRGEPGTVVEVRLPAWGEDLVPEDSLDDAEPRILIIDDDALVLRSFERMLRSKGAVTALNGGREAAERLRKDQAWDVVLCDLMMPEIGGNDLFEMVQESWPELVERWVVVTGGAFTGSAADFLRTTQLPLLEKPIDQRELMNVVDGILARRG